MEGRPELNEALASLLGTASSPASGGRRKQAPPRVLVAQSCLDGEHLQLLEGSYQAVADKELPRTLREGGWQVVAFTRLNTTLVRSLRESDVALAICTAALAEDRLTQLLGLQADGGPALLGPEARVHVEDAGTRVVVAPDAGELLALRRALGQAKLALSPAPAWLLEALRPQLDAGHISLVGMVDASVIGRSDWIEWARALEPEDPARHVLVPLGLPELDLDDPDPDVLEACLAGHMLERCTGPVFPSPRVIAAIHRGRDQDSGKAGAGSPSAEALWNQAARALPRLGRRVQMEAPLADVSLEVPASAFLAQEALLRRSAVSQLAAEPEAPILDLDPDRLERAREVLRASAEVLSEHESKVVLRGHGFVITRQAVANSASGAAQFADRIGYPVVLKALSPDLRRKSEIGAVRLDLPNAASVRRAHADILSRVERDAPLARLDGVVVAEMVQAGLEFRCGGLRRRDGGVAFYATPVLAGQSHEAALFPGPLSWVEALELSHAALQRLPAPALRRAADPRVEQLAEVLHALSEFFERCGERLRAVHLDPVRLLHDDERPYAVLDARIEQEAHLDGL